MEQVRADAVPLERIGHVHSLEAAGVVVVAKEEDLTDDRPSDMRQHDFAGGRPRRTREVGELIRKHLREFRRYAVGPRGQAGGGSDREARPRLSGVRRSAEQHRASSFGGHGSSPMVSHHGGDGHACAVTTNALAWRWTIPSRSSGTRASVIAVAHLVDPFGPLSESLDDRRAELDDDAGDSGSVTGRMWLVDRERFDGDVGPVAALEHVDDRVRRRQREWTWLAGTGETGRTQDRHCRHHGEEHPGVGGREAPSSRTRGEPSGSRGHGGGRNLRPGRRRTSPRSGRRSRRSGHVGQAPGRHRG